MGSLLKVIGLGVLLAAGVIGAFALAGGSVALLALAVLLAVIGAYALFAGARESSGEGRKVCPECAEPVQAAAHKCRYCGHAFDAATIPSQRRPSTSRINDDSDEAHRCSRCGALTVDRITLVGPVWRCAACGLEESQL